MDDIEQIKQLKYRYVRALDTKSWADFADCLVPEATSSYAADTPSFANRDEIVAYMRENMGAGLVSMHQVHHPEIEVNGDRATGVWYLQDKVIVADHRFVLEGAAFYHDRYARTPEGWRIEHTGYERTYEATWSTADTPSFTVTKPHPGQETCE